MVEVWVYHLKKKGHLNLFFNPQGEWHLVTLEDGPTYFLHHSKFGILIAS